ncbi:hypothetical protein CPB83DRAFT_843016 [Crepidotus variabilis]|uniref:DUF7719 domain-containing protein n=1 Tax=Crepidotus variabilis TaxID=179855 RepID=A0A9P6ETE3_9AGAR|nr:hypothetical protein CPB83DRAFT_843016 [Crepidotus variabilis]
MPRQRKGKAASQTVPEVSSQAPRNDAPSKPLIEISEEEQWRIIKQTGILEVAEERDASGAQEIIEAESLSLGDEIFNAALLIIPFSFLLLLMEILIHHQYGKRVSLDMMMDRMGPGVPILSLFIFYTVRYKHHRRTQFFLFLLSCAAGSRLMYQYNRANWLVKIKQCPPLITIWVYTVLQLDLGPCVLGLLTVAGFSWLKGLTVQ